MSMEAIQQWITTKTTPIAQLPLLREHDQHHTQEEMLNIAKEVYKRNYGCDAELVCCAPGRVNLIGEHLDYNDGFVLPIALHGVGTLIVGGSRHDDGIIEGMADVITCCRNADEPQRVIFNLRELKAGKPKWANYVKGVLYAYGVERLLQHVPAHGFNAVIISNVPVGAGLSSSASLEVAMLTFIEQLTGQAVASATERALICQKAEHQFAGMPCGIMDQMVCVAGQKDHALLLDCRSLVTFQIPFVLFPKELTILICYSGVRHELSSSEYPLRRKQCTEALQLMGLSSYRDATMANLSALPHNTKQDVLLRRARHVITEIERTQEAAAALREHNFAKMGQLMTASHLSLRDDFEVSCPELDVLVDAAVNCPGVLGSRMTGGGFGGCTVTLLQITARFTVIEMIKKRYFGVFGRKSDLLEFHTVKAGDGARRLEL